MQMKLYKLWLKLVADYWDHILDETSGYEEQTFRYQLKHHPKGAHKDLVSLAKNFKHRNRNRLWEYFYNTALPLKKEGKRERLRATILTGRRWVQFPRESPSWADMTPVSWEFTYCPDQLHEHLTGLDFLGIDEYKLPKLEKNPIREVS